MAVLVLKRKSILLDFKKKRRKFFLSNLKKKKIIGSKCCHLHPTLTTPGRGKKSKWTGEKERKEQGEMVDEDRDPKRKRDKG